MTDNPYQPSSADPDAPAVQKVHASSRILVALAFALTFPAFYFSCFYALWVLVFGDTREITWPMIAVLLASGLGGAAAYFYARLGRRLGLPAWPLTIISAWLLSAIIYAAAVVLDGWLG